MKTTKSQKKLEKIRDGVRMYNGTPSTNFDKGLEWIIRDALGRKSGNNTGRRQALSRVDRLELS